MISFLLSVTVSIFIAYIIYKKLSTQISEPELKERSEINSLIIEFNKITKNNIDLLEEKVSEIKNLLVIVDRKMADYKNLELNTKVKASFEKTLVDLKEDNKKHFSRPEIDIKHSHIKQEKSNNKSEMIKTYLQEGKSDKQIAKLLGISKAEVQLYMGMMNK